MLDARPLECNVALDGSRVLVLDGSPVLALDGSRVLVLDGSRVLVLDGSRVCAARRRRRRWRVRLALSRIRATSVPTSLTAPSDCTRAARVADLVADFFREDPGHQKT